MLRLLGSPEAQLAYERDVPIANVPAELFCMWFDDLYHPASDLFEASFSPGERAILAEFHERFEEVADSLPGDFPQVADLHAHSEWQTLMRDAVATLKSLGEDAAWFGRQAAERGV